MDLSSFFTQHHRAAAAFSGGVDSAFLLYAAKQSGADVTAYYVKTLFQPAFELADARRLARELAVPLRVLEEDILADGTVAANPPDRCYYCKKRIFAAIAEAAARDGYSLLLDGTNASDEESDRPGMRALRELRGRRTGSGSCPGRRGCSPGTSPPTPALPPALRQAKRSPRKSWPEPNGRRIGCSRWAFPISGCAPGGILR